MSTSKNVFNFSLKKKRIQHYCVISKWNIKILSVNGFQILNFTFLSNSTITLCSCVDLLNWLVTKKKKKMRSRWEILRKELYNSIIIDILEIKVFISIIWSRDILYHIMQKFLKMKKTLWDHCLRRLFVKFPEKKIINQMWQLKQIFIILS